MICSRPSPHWWCRGAFSCSKLMADIFMWPRPSADVIKGALIWFRFANHLPAALMSPVSMIYFLLSDPTLFLDPDIYFVKILAVILCWSMESSLESWLRWVWMVFTQSSNFSVSMSKAKTDHNESKWHLQFLLWSKYNWMLPWWMIASSCHRGFGEMFITDPILFVYLWSAYIKLAAFL